MKKKSWIFGGLALVIVVIVAFTFKSGQQVEGVSAEQGSLRTWIEDTAYVQGRDDVVMQASQSGKIIQVAVEAGQAVAAGQELLVMENPDMKYQLDLLGVQLEQLQGELTTAQIAREDSRSELQKDQKDLERNRQLFQAGALAQAEYEASLQKNQRLIKSVEQKEQTCQSLQRQLEKQSGVYHDLEYRNQQLVVRSPRAGIILDIPVKKEQSVIPGNTLVQVGTEGELEVKTELLSDDLAAVKLGQKVEITAPLLGDKVLVGQVKKIYPRAYEKTSALGVIQRRVPVLISLPANDRLKPGYEVQVKIETQLKPNVLILPREAIRLDADGKTEVLAVVEGRIKHLKVETGLKNIELVEISSGLSVGQMVVRDASSDIKENARVKTSQN